ncbi:hypothetical protein FA95DRAFT_902233 [Auriscalpium vulgare]|uniref:Uncharacterized protein n=1 Tax=Auriscalpium vulgare TaxID=40419 RepID=A0ACB8R854_9AGAM|nr:hypothetical protein FA95DRAFT_902233 [Auriscalpium vulgare]
MQVDETHVQPGLDDDEDSLFGSPPPSPSRALLLRIQLSSEPSTSPTPSSSRPTTIHPSQSIFAPEPARISSVQSSTSSSREHSRVPPTRRSQKGKERASTPRPPPPPIELPNPDEPPPANFLRNQQALLGHAGLVGGVNPANLAKRHSRGCTSQNPIVVEDAFNPPPLGQGGAYAVDASHLTRPTGEEVITSLVKQGNVFPVLESLLRLLSGASSTAPHPSSGGWTRGYQESQEEDSGPSAKRRKLYNVPAGAADWDVPYPFPHGEGPEQYRVRWERERVKQLLAQLVSLVKGAARSAGARTYMQYGHAPVDSQALSQAFWNRQEIRDVTNAPSHSSTRPSGVPLPSVQDRTPFDNLIASLLSSSLSQPSSDANSSSSHLPQQASTPEPNFFGSQDDASALDTMSSPQFDDFMAILNGSSLSAMDIDQGPTPSAPLLSLNQSSQSNVTDAMIDPALLEMSWPPAGGAEVGSIGGFAASSSTPALVQSPMASTSSLFDPDPPTPREDVQIEPEVYRSDQAEDPVAAATALLEMATNSSSQQAIPVMTIPPAVPRPHVVQQPHPYPLQPYADSRPASVDPAATVAPPPALATASQLMALLDSRRVAQKAAPKLNKQDVIQRAKERRRQLMVELERAKIELWETTLEQGVLAHLVKDSELS